MDNELTKSLSPAPEPGAPTGIMIHIVEPKRSANDTIHADRLKIVVSKSSNGPYQSPQLCSWNQMLGAMVWAIMVAFSIAGIMFGLYLILSSKPAKTPTSQPASSVKRQVSPAPVLSPVSHRQGSQDPASGIEGQGFCSVRPSDEQARVCRPLLSGCSRQPAHNRDGPPGHGLHIGVDGTSRVGLGFETFWTSNDPCEAGGRKVPADSNPYFNERIR